MIRPQTIWERIRDVSILESNPFKRWWIIRKMIKHEAKKISRKTK